MIHCQRPEAVDRGKLAWRKTKAPNAVAESGRSVRGDRVHVDGFMARQSGEAVDGDARAEEIVPSEVAEVSPRISPSVHRLLGSRRLNEAPGLCDPSFDRRRLDSVNLAASKRCAGPRPSGARRPISALSAASGGFSARSADALEKYFAPWGFSLGKQARRWRRSSLQGDRILNPVNRLHILRAVHADAHESQIQAWAPGSRWQGPPRGGRPTRKRRPRRPASAAREPRNCSYTYPSGGVTDIACRSPEDRPSPVDLSNR